jgi:SIR2-like domain
MATDDDMSLLFKEYPRVVSHLRSQVEKKRFGLVLGAGTSFDFKVPLWKDLVDYIADDPAVNGKSTILGEACKSPLPYKTELLFQRFRKLKMEKEKSPDSLSTENSTTAEWLKLCQKYIYRDAASNKEEALSGHPYFESLIPLIQNSHLTINFNFDDYLEQALSLRKRPSDKSNRGFEVVTDPWPQFRRSDSVIYHPHGYVPRGLMESPTDRFVFSEAAYSKQYVGSRGHDSSFMTAHFARNTCLLIGCSLEDELRNVLMRGAQMNPGNYHYYLHFTPPGHVCSPEDMSQIQETNFKVYNLITLFATSTMIQTLLQLINPEKITDLQLKDIAGLTNTPTKFTFYMTGSIGVGKSTTANLLRSLTVFDEWLERRLEILGQPWDTLTDVEKTEADEWIANQFKQKNDALRHVDKASICVVDRPPLDPLVFTPAGERAKKAQSLLNKICPSDVHEIVSGVVIVLLGIPEELSARVKATGREDYTADKLLRMQKTIESVYGKDEGVVVIDARFLTIPEVTKKVAQVIHRDDYVPANLMNMMRKYSECKDEPQAA